MDTNRKREFHETIHAIACNAENLAYRLRDVADLLGVPTAAAAANEEVRYKTTRSKRSKLVDPEEPEKPQRAYNYFIKENYPAIQKKFPNENKKIMTELAALWKETSSKDRKQYEDLANKDKKRYEVEKQKFEAYRLDHPFDQAKEGITLNAKRLQRKQAEAGTPTGNKITGKGELVDGSKDGSSSSSSASVAYDGSSDDDRSEFSKKETFSNKKINTQKANGKERSSNKKVNNQKFNEKEPSFNKRINNQNATKKNHLPKKSTIKNPMKKNHLLTKNSVIKG